MGIPSHPKHPDGQTSQARVNAVTLAERVLMVPQALSMRCICTYRGSIGHTALFKHVGGNYRKKKRVQHLVSLRIRGLHWSTVQSGSEAASCSASPVALVAYVVLVMLSCPADGRHTAPGFLCMSRRGPVQSVVERRYAGFWTVAGMFSLPSETDANDGTRNEHLTL